MVVALKVQHTVHYHMGPVGYRLFMLFLRLFFNNRCANNQISGQWHRYTRWRFKWEGQNIGGFVLAPVLVIQDRKSTRLNSSHVRISYAVFCLKKKKHNPRHLPTPSTHRTPPSSTYIHL